MSLRAVGQGLGRSAISVPDRAGLARRQTAVDRAVAHRARLPSPARAPHRSGEDPMAPRLSRELPVGAAGRPAASDDHPVRQFLVAHRATSAAIRRSRFVMAPLHQSLSQSRHDGSIGANLAARGRAAPETWTLGVKYGAWSGVSEGKRDRRSVRGPRLSLGFGNYRPSLQQCFLRHRGPPWHLGSSHRFPNKKSCKRHSATTAFL